jgi:large subunit ribosomal protein L22
MEARAIGRYLRISHLKLRKVIKAIKGMKVDDALAVLDIIPNKGAKMTYKVLFSAKSNFKFLHPEENADGLVIKTIYVDQAPVFKRLLPRARGRADILRKQSSHLTVIIGAPELESALSDGKE